MRTLTTDRATQIGAVLESIVTLSRALATPRATPFGDAVLTRTQLEILFILARAAEPVTPGRLAATVKVTPGAITQTMDQLRYQRLVEQSSSDLDGRVRVAAHRCRSHPGCRIRSCHGPPHRPLVCCSHRE